MTDQGARYDRIAEGYAQWWSPVHRPATLALLDEIEAPVAAGATRILDVGCGTGALVSAVVTRWPHVSVTGVDLSPGMLAVAERELDAVPVRARERITLVQGRADRLPFDDGAFDIVVSAFVLQLVPSRYRTLREARRVLASRGTLAYVTWLPGGVIPADEAYEEALADAGLTRLDLGGDQGDAKSPRAAVAQLHRAGFASATARIGELDHQFTPEAYVAFVSRFDDEDLFETLGPAEREALEADVVARLRALPPDGLRLRIPIAYAKGRRSSRA